MDNSKTFVAAVVQAAPVFLDKQASIAKACDLILEASKTGADIIALPEVFISGYPYWLWFKSIADGTPYSIRLFESSIQVPGPETEALGRAARKAEAYVVIGVNEVDNKALYNTLLFFDRSGALIGKRRKLKATYAEKIIWADGDASTHEVYSTDFGVLSGLICGEHAMALPGFSLSAMGEQVHVSSWVGFSSCLAQDRRDAFRTLSEVASKFHAVSFQSAVLCTQSLVDEYTLEVMGHPPEMEVGGGWSAIIAPGSGKVLAGPLIDDEGIISAEVNLRDAIPYYINRDVTAQYWSPYFNLSVDRTPHTSHRSKDATPRTTQKMEPLSREQDTSAETAETAMADER
ncbi:MAG: carbon-nitrogen hydrolase family protein [Aquisalimonadaceae bacterium]